MKSTCRNYTRGELDRQRVEREIQAAREYVMKPGECPGGYLWMFDWMAEEQLMGEETKQNG